LYRGSRSKLRTRSGLTLKHPVQLSNPNTRKVLPGPSGLGPCPTSSYCYLVIPANSGSKRSRYFLRKVRAGLSTGLSSRSLTFFTDTAFEMGLRVCSAIRSGIPVIAIDTPANVFDLLCQTSGWVTDDETWKTVASSFTLSSTGYAPQIREAISRRQAEGHRFVLLFSVRDERVHLFAL
jgi:hypothetical protein